MHTPRHRQRGALALTVTLLLLLASLLGAAYSQRGVLVEQRAAANHYRSAQAFEAAEAGLEWALARLNDSRRVDSECRPSADAGATTFRERYLRQDAAGRYAGLAWDGGGGPQPLLPSCVRNASGWECSCPADAAPSLPAGSSGAPAFTLRLEGDPRAGIVHLVSSGCTRVATPCLAGGPNAEIRASAALFPALRNTPAAALTVRGAIDADGIPFGAHNPDPRSGGIALHAGGAVHASRARLTGPAGAVAPGRVVSDDDALAAFDAQRWFAAWFGVDAASWRQLPLVQPVECADDCAAALSRAIEHGATLLAVDGDLLIEGPVELGSAERPVVIVATGAARLRGGVALTGVLHAATLRWDDAAAPDAWLRGAAISAGDYGGNASPDLVYDPEVLARLARYGSLVHVPGSWRDF